MTEKNVVATESQLIPSDCMSQDAELGLNPELSVGSPPDTQVYFAGSSTIPSSSDDSVYSLSLQSAEDSLDCMETPYHWRQLHQQVVEVDDEKKTWARREESQPEVQILLSPSMESNAEETAATHQSASTSDSHQNTTKEAGTTGESVSIDRDTDRSKVLSFDEEAAAIPEQTSSDTSNCVCTTKETTVGALPPMPAKEASQSSPARHNLLTKPASVKILLPFELTDSEHQSTSSLPTDKMTRVERMPRPLVDSGTMDNHFSKHKPQRATKAIAGRSIASTKNETVREEWTPDARQSRPLPPPPPLRSAQKGRCCLATVVVVLSLIIIGSVMLIMSPPPPSIWGEDTGLGTATSVPAPTPVVGHTTSSPVVGQTASTPVVEQTNSPISLSDALTVILPSVVTQPDPPASAPVVVQIPDSPVLTSIPTQVSVPAPDTVLSVTNTDRPTQAPVAPPPIPPPVTPPTEMLRLRSVVSVHPDEFENPESPYFWASHFLMQENYSFRNLVQRFGVVLLDKATGGSFSTADRHECGWYGITCDSNKTVTAIRWSDFWLPGHIPEDMGLLSSLQVLDLGENRLTGSIPLSLYTLANLEELFLHSNRLTGTLSESIGQLGKLKRLLLGNNQLRGPIPRNLGSPAGGSGNVRPLGENELSGNIPFDWIEGRDQLIRLRVLYLNHNRFSGALPSTFGTIGNGRLQMLSIQNNSFTGQFPGFPLYKNLMNVLEIHNNDFDSIDKNNVCNQFVFNYGEMVMMRADCAVCECKHLCGQDQCYNPTIKNETKDKDKKNKTRDGRENE